MKRWHVGVSVLIVVAVVILSAAVLASHIDSLNAIKHDTERWAVIEDVNADRIAVEPTSNHVWSELVNLNQNGTKMLVGGVVERYNNKWGFRFKPDTVKVAQFTAEGLQATMEYISTHIDDWLNGWAYVSSKVIEVHS